MYKIYIPVKVKHEYLSRCLASIAAYHNDIIMVEQPRMTFTQTMNWIQQDAIKRGLDVFFWMHADAECERDVISEILATDDWDIHFTNVDALSATKIEVAKAIHWDENFDWYVSDSDYYRRCQLAGYRIKNDVTSDKWSIRSMNGVTHYCRQTVAHLPARDAWIAGVRENKNQELYRKKWGGDPDKETYLEPYNRNQA